MITCGLRPGARRSRVASKVVWSSWVALAPVAFGQTPVLIEDFEFCVSDESCDAGILDMTDLPNQPALYINGDGGNASPQEGRFSLGMDVVFCINWQEACVPGTFMGFRRTMNPDRWPGQCPSGDHFVPLMRTYGDPEHSGSDPADLALADLLVVWDIYGDGGFQDGLTGTHLWLKFVDCEGEGFEFINHSEESLFSNNWTLDVIMGSDVIRISPDSLTNVPDGDRLLTEIAAIEVFIQDTDDPPTTAGKWYVDNLRIIEPIGDGLPDDWDGDGDVDLFDFSAYLSCVSEPDEPAGSQCGVFDADGDDDVDWVDFGVFQTQFSTGR